MGLIYSRRVIKEIRVRLSHAYEYDPRRRGTPGADGCVAFRATALSFLGPKSCAPIARLVRAESRPTDTRFFVWVMDL